MSLGSWPAVVLAVSLVLVTITSTVEKSELKEQYESKLQEQAIKYDELQLQIKERLAMHSQLDADAADVRMQFSPAPTPTTSDRSDPTTELLSRRIKALEAALNEATTLIKERDQCAVDYNALKEQCSGGKNGR